jgi:hypothetical protein
VRDNLARRAARFNIALDDVSLTVCDFAHSRSMQLLTYPSTALDLLPRVHRRCRS